MYECETRALPKGNREKLQWRGNKRFSGVVWNPSRLLTKKENFRVREREDELRRAIIQGNPYDFQFYHALRKPDLLFPRHYDSQVTPLLSSSKLMKIKLSRRVGHECPDIFELWNLQMRDSVFSRKIVKDPKCIMINIIYINVMPNTHIYKVQDASVAWCKRDVTCRIYTSNLMDRKYNNRCLILQPASLGWNDNWKTSKKIRDKSGK